MLKMSQDKADFLSLWDTVMRARPIVSMNWGLSLKLIQSATFMNATSVPPALWLHQETLYWRRLISRHRIAQ
jgi:hypothetical protein